MKLYYGKSGQIIGFSRDKIKLPGEFMRIPDKEVPADLRKSVMSGKYSVVAKKLKQGNAPSDVGKHLEALVASVDEVLKIKTTRSGTVKKSTSKVALKKATRKKTTRKKS